MDQKRERALELVHSIQNRKDRHLGPLLSELILLFGMGSSRNLAHELGLNSQTVRKWLTDEITGPIRESSILALYKLIDKIFPPEANQQTPAAVDQPVFTIIKEILDEAGEVRIKRIIIEFE